MAEKSNTRQRSRFSAVLTLYLIFLAVLIVLTCGVFAVIVNSQRILAFIHRDSYVYQLGIDNLEDTTKRTVPASELYYDGKLYFSMDDIARLCDLTVMGDYSKRTYFPSDDDSQYVTFFYSSDKIVINGEATTMADIMFEKNGEVYVPASFFYNFSGGISITFDKEKSKITVSRVSTGTKYNTLGKEQQIYQDIVFLSGSSNELEHLNDKEVFANTVPLESDPPPEPDPTSSQGNGNSGTSNDNRPVQTPVTGGNGNSGGPPADNKPQDGIISGSDSSTDDMLSGVLD